MVKRLRESTNNIFYCAEITYDKSGRDICVYTSDIKEVQRSTKPKDELKIEGGFMVRRKYFRSREEAESFIDSQDKCMTINRDESIGSKRRSRRINEIAVPTQSKEEIDDLIERLESMWWRESNIIQALSISFSDDNLDRLLDSPYFAEKKNDIIDDLDEMISKADEIKQYAEYARNILKKN